MGLFGFGKKKDPAEKAAEKEAKARKKLIGPVELLYARLMQGKEWGPDYMTWDMKNAYAGLSFGGCFKRCEKAGIIEEADGCIRLTDAGRDMLALHDELSYIVKNIKTYRYIPMNWQAMWKAREKDPEAPILDVIEAGLDEEDLADGYYNMDWRMVAEDEQDGFDRALTRISKAKARETAKELRKVHAAARKEKEEEQP